MGATLVYDGYAPSNKRTGKTDSEQETASTLQGETPQEETESTSVWQSVKNFFRYYQDFKGLMWSFSVETVKFLESTSGRRSEIRILHDEKLGKTAWDGKSWDLQLMDSCIVCGGGTDTEWIDETQDVQDVRYAAWGTTTGFCSGVLLALVCSSLVWSPIVFFAAIVIGMLVGYRLRRTVRIRLRYRRDRRHASETQVPSVEVFPDQILIRVGSREAKQKFTQYQQDNAASSPGYATGKETSAGPIPSDSVPRAIAEELPPIPLDDDET
ncbi:MAG: hypothetical protein N2C12_15105 [Planctomycetales bacterium]